MSTKTLIPITATWLATLVAAYYFGYSTNTKHTTPEISESATQSSKAKLYSQLNGNRYSSESTRSARAQSYDKGASSSPFAKINQLNDPIQQTDQLNKYMHTISGGEFGSIVNVDRTYEVIGEYSMLLHSWGKAAPSEALAYLKKNIKSPDFAINIVLGSWARTNPDEAITWANANHAGDKANPYLVGIIRSLADTNPSHATTLLQQLPISEESDKALHGLTPHIADLGVSGAEQWLRSVEDSKLVSQASAYLAEHFTKQDPQLGAQWVNSLTDEAARKEAIPKVLDNWLWKDLSAAKSWVDTLSHKDRVIAEPKVLHTYASKNPHAAADWLDSQTSSEHYQKLLLEFSKGAAHKDPIIALNYGNELLDEDARTRAVKNALLHLNGKDSSKAREWLNNNKIPKGVEGFAERVLNDPDSF
ncbi:hypothetical protein [Rubritalea tangerina]|uniref:HEAT repeat domain-containing protein n=1 Tax=Rubritalea tangerina TaxID=430798 RepID=A0ABW4ZA16_9BACT